METLLAFIGFGEAAYHIAKGLKSEGMKQIFAFDINQDDEKAGPIIRERAREAGVKLCSSLEEACTSATFLASLTSAGVAVKVAQSALPFLSSGQVFVDMNSAGPAVKEQIGKISRREEVRICDAAVMGTVPQGGHKVKMLLSGDGAHAFHDSLTPYGMKLEVLDSDLGGSSAIKMLKSIVMKGLPQLMLESMQAASRYGVLDALVKSLNESLTGKTVEQLSNTFFARTLVHAHRRAVEMEHVISTLEGMNMDASMSDVTRRKLERLDENNYRDLIGTEITMDFKKVLELMNRKEMNDE